MEDNKLCLEKQPLSDELLNKMNAYWRAANYLSAGQLYLLDNPLLKPYLDKTSSMYTATVSSNVMIWI